MKSVQKFDGTTNASSFCDRIDNVLTVYKLSSSWALLNFHLFVQGEVSNWWKWSQIAILKDLDDANMDRKWGELKKSLKRYYDPESIMKEASKKMKAIKFEDCETAGDYVSKKLAMFAIMDPEMKKEKQIQKLIKGLPSHLSSIMWGSEPKTVPDLLNRLRRMAPAKSSGHGFKKETDKKETGSSKFSYSSSSSKSKKGIDSKGNRVCYGCGEKDHFFMKCPKRQSNPVPGSSSMNVMTVEENQQPKN